MGFNYLDRPVEENKVLATENKTENRKLIRELLALMESCDERGQEKIFIAAMDAYDLHQAQKLRLDAEIQRISEINKAMSSGEPLDNAAAKSLPVDRH